jgi:hypothetical protein
VVGLPAAGLPVAGRKAADHPAAQKDPQVVRAAVTGPVKSVVSPPAVVRKNCHPLRANVAAAELKAMRQAAQVSRVVMLKVIPAATVASLAAAIVATPERYLAVWVVWARPANALAAALLLPKLKLKLRLKLLAAAAAAGPVAQREP